MLFRSFNASEIVIGDLTNFNTNQFGSSVPVSASVVKSFGNYTGLSPYTYFTPQNIVFGTEELYGTTQLQTIGITSSYQFVFGSLGYFGDGKITLSSPDVSANIRTVSTDASIQLFKFNTAGATYASVEAYVSVKGPYFDASEIVIGDLTKFNTKGQFGSSVPLSAVVSKQFGNYTGTSPYTYITPQNVVFGTEEFYNSSQVKVYGEVPL